MRGRCGFVWEEITTDPLDPYAYFPGQPVLTTIRAKVPGGWFVVITGGSMFTSLFYPDPKHEWDEQQAALISKGGVVHPKPIVEKINNRPSRRDSNPRYEIAYSMTCQDASTPHKYWLPCDPMMPWYGVIRDGMVAKW